MAAAILAVKRSPYWNKFEKFVDEYDQKGFFSFRWAAIDLCIIALMAASYIK